MWNKRRVLVTGANGFLAGWIVKKLLEKKAIVYSLVYDKVSFSVFDLEHLDKKTHVIYGDILDFHSVKRLIKHNKIQTIFHVGAQAINKTAIENPYDTLETNIRGTYNILEAARLLSPKTQIIVASSDKAYGSHKKMPYKEHFALHGEFPYEVSKSCADLISLAYHNTYRMPICVVRCGNIYGGGDWHFSRVVPATIFRLYNDKPPLLISETKRDFIYVEDVAEAYIKLAEQMKKGTIGHAFNFGTGRPILTSELLTLIAKAMGKENIKIRRSKEKRFEIPVQYLHVGKAKRMLGLQEPMSIEDGLDKTVSWYMKHMGKIKRRNMRD